MKKIFAIALALVMVLSMASAFASPCTAGFDWTTTAAANKCGKGSIEVVPYVKANDACEKYAWQVSTCAGAVNSEKVNYALKLTVDANADAEWWKTADLLITYKGLKASLTDYVFVDFATAWTAMESAIATNDTVGKANTFYWNTTKGAFELVTSTFEFGDANVLSEEVANAPKAKVCATLKAENAFTYGTVGEYVVEVVYDGTSKEVTELKVFDKKDNKLVSYDVDDTTNKIKEIKFFDENLSDCAPYSRAAIEAFFGITTSTKITAANVKANFGWKDKVESCFSWSDKAVSVVDAECVVAIPKTGDASVLAWLF